LIPCGWPERSGELLVFRDLFRLRARRWRRRRDQTAVSIRLHAELQAHAMQDFLDFVERLAAEVLGPQHVLLGLLHQFADGLDSGVLKAVIRADGKLEFFDRAAELIADAIH